MKTKISQEIALTVIDSWQSDDMTSWYRKWSDGWIEQGGSIITSASGFSTKTLVIPMINNKYQLLLTTTDPDTNGKMNGTVWRNKTTNTFQVASAYNDNFYSLNVDWYACGY